MGNFSEKVLEWLKSQGTNGGGCVKNLIWTALCVILVAAVCITTVCSYTSKNDEDMARLLTLLNQEFSPYTVEITGKNESELYSKIRNNTIYTKGSLFSNNKLDLDKFLSSDISFLGTLNLTPNDLAILLSHSSNGGTAVCSADMSVAGSIIDWSIVIKLDLNSDSASGLSDSVKNADGIYIKFSAKVVYSAETKKCEVLSNKVQINRLEGEDNDFAVKYIMENMKIDSATLKEYAAYPFTFAIKQASIWSVNFTFDNTEKTFIFSPL